jgi:hypothetical protein
MLPAAVAAPAAVTLEGLEVTQAIQHMPHTVPLVAQKATVVRVYLGTQSHTPVTVRGVLLVRANHAGATWIQVPSIQPVQLNPTENGQLRLKRERIDKSLNFRLPAATTTAGAWTVALWQIQRLTPPAVYLPVPAGATRVIVFQATPPLRVRVIGVRYRDSTHGPTQTHEPAVKDFALIHSWLGRAYPVSAIVWSQVTVDGPNAWPFDAAQNNAYIRALRMQDIQHGTDRRTHYFGLVDDAGGNCFMRGLASGVPTAAPDPATVASGPTGSATWGWDFDGSYGDWYTGHELGHTFGRLHAEFCGATGGGPYPYPNGQLSPNDGSFVGFDVGDPNHNLPMQALPGVVWHDVMTYCSYQWLSSFTYIGIRDRLVAEAALPAGAPIPAGPVAAPAAARTGGKGRSRSGRGSRSKATAGGGNMSSSGGIHVVALINVTLDTGRIQFVTPVPAAESTESAGAVPSEFVLRLLRADRMVIGEYPAPFYPDACTDAGSDRTGLLDATVPAVEDAGAIELVHAGKVLDTYEPTARPGPLKDIKPLAGQGPAGVAMAAAGAPANPVLTWTDTGAMSPAALGGPAAGGPTYLVQLSTDDGQTWTTIGMGLRQPQVTVDRNLLHGATEVKVRVSSTNGFQTESTTKTIPVEDL